MTPRVRHELDDHGVVLPSLDVERATTRYHRMVDGRDPWPVFSLPTSVRLLALAGAKAGAA